MAFLVNASFFLGEINIPNSTVAGAAKDNIDYLISVHEPYCLLHLLGYPLYKILDTENSARMDALLLGAEYTNAYGELTKWKGLLYGNGTTLNQSLIAYYIYEQWARSKATVATGKGNAVMQENAATAASFGDKIIHAQNKFSSLAHECLSFLWNYGNANEDIFPEFNTYQYAKAKDFITRINGFGI